MNLIDLFHSWNSYREGFFVGIVSLSLFDSISCCSVACDDDDSGSLIKQSIECIKSILLYLLRFLGSKRVVCLVGEKYVVVFGICFVKVLKSLESTKSAVKYPDHGLL